MSFSFCLNQPAGVFDHFKLFFMNPSVLINITQSDDDWVFWNGWAKGSPPGRLPATAGFPVGGADGAKAFKLQIHYNNPGRKHGVQDSSGFRVYFAEQLRQHDLGYLILGDPKSALLGERIESGLTKHTFDCPSTCTENYFEADEVTILMVGCASSLSTVQCCVFF